MKKTLKLEGMMCDCCNARITNNLKNVAGVSDAGGDYKTNTAWVFCIPETKDEDLANAVRLSGYTLKEIDDPFGNTKKY